MKKVTLDSSCFSTFIKDLEIWENLYELKKRGKVKLFTTLKTHNELFVKYFSKKPVRLNEKMKKKVKTFADLFEKTELLQELDETIDISEAIKLEVRIKDILFPNKNLGMDDPKYDDLWSDVAIFLVHYISRNDVFLTKDDDFLSKKHILEKEFNTRIENFYNYGTLIFS